MQDGLPVQFAENARIPIPIPAPEATSGSYKNHSCRDRRSRRIHRAAMRNNMIQSDEFLSRIEFPNGVTFTRPGNEAKAGRRSRYTPPAVPWS
jgi:hypothetical protein